MDDCTPHSNDNDEINHANKISGFSLQMKECRWIFLKFNNNIFLSTKSMAFSPIKSFNKKGYVIFCNKNVDKSTLLKGLVIVFIHLL